MNVQEILPQRIKEIESKQNAATRNPLYVVYSLIEQGCSGHSDISITVNLKGRPCEFGYIDALSDEPEFKVSDEGMGNPEEIIRFWKDRFVAYFFTRTGAEEYLVYQKHNLTDAYIYVHSSGYANREAEIVFN